MTIVVNLWFWWGGSLTAWRGQFLSSCSLESALTGVELVRKYRVITSLSRTPRQTDKGYTWLMCNNVLVGSFAKRYQINVPKTYKIVTKTRNSWSLCNYFFFLTNKPTKTLVFTSLSRFKNMFLQTEKSRNSSIPKADKVPPGGFPPYFWAVLHPIPPHQHQQTQRTWLPVSGCRLSPSPLVHLRARAAPPTAVSCNSEISLCQCVCVSPSQPSPVHQTPPPDSTTGLLLTPPPDFSWLHHQTPPRHSTTARWLLLHRNLLDKASQFLTCLFQRQVCWFTSKAKPSGHWIRLRPALVHLWIRGAGHDTVTKQS